MCQKVKYSTRAEALRDINIIKNGQKRFSKKFKDAHKANRKLVPYLCVVCECWHLTTQTKRKYK